MLLDFAGELYAIKIFYFQNLFSQSATLPVYLFAFLFVSIHFFFISLFYSAENFQGFHLNFINQIARTLGRAVDKFLNGSFTRAVYFWKAKLEATRISKDIKGIIFHIFWTWSKLDCSILFLKVNC